METKKDKFKAAVEKRRQQKEKQDNKFQGDGGQFEEVVYTSLALKQDKVIRIIGDPLLVREKGSDPKLSHISMILGDNDKKFRCIWPDKSEDSSWILWKIYDKVGAYEWSNEDNTKHYIHKDRCPDLLKRVLKNNSDVSFETGWRPSKVVHLNVIDRHDMEYHKEHEKLKVLSKKASEFGDGRIWFEPGIPEFLYSTIWDNVVEYNGDWHNYDVIVRKLDESPWYAAFHAIDDLKKIDPNVKQFIVEKDLTEEESSWEGYDFDKIFPITSYTKIKSRLGKLIQKVDLEFNTKYFDELSSLVEIEEKERKKEEPKKTITKEKEIPEKEEKEEKEVVEKLDDEPEEKPKERVKTRERIKEEPQEISIPWDKLADGSFNDIEYAGVPHLTDEEKAMVKSVNEDGSFEFVEGCELLKNPSSDFISPEEFHIDPLSGEEF